MPRMCSIFGCRSNYRKEKQCINTFALPKDPWLRQKWIDAIPRDLSKLKNPVVCLKHFPEEDIIRVDRIMYKGELKEYPRIIPKLTPNAVPSIFLIAPDGLSNTNVANTRRSPKKEVARFRLRKVIKNGATANASEVKEKKNSLPEYGDALKQRLDHRERRTYPGDKSEMPGGNGCSVAICNSRSTTSSFRFFTFPSDPKIKKIWIQKCRRKDKWNPDKARICSKHFTNEDFEDMLKAELLHLKPKKLKPTAVPSLYLLPQDDQDDIEKRRRSKYIEQKHRREIVDELLANSLEINNQQQLLDSNSLDYEDLDPPAGSDTPPVESIEYITPNYDPIISSSCNTPSSNTCSTVSIPAKRGKRKLKQEVDDDFPVPVSTANEYIEEESLTKSDSKTEDRYDAFGKYVACKLREIGKKQSIFVEKIINEALFEGELGTLTRNHKIIDETQVSARPDVQYNAFVPYAVQCVSPNSGSSSPPQPLITDARSIYNVQGRFSEPETQSTHILP